MEGLGTGSAGVSVEGPEIAKGPTRFRQPTEGEGVPVGIVPASVRISLCQPRDPLESKESSDSLGLSQRTGV